MGERQPAGYTQREMADPYAEYQVPAQTPVYAPAILSGERPGDPANAVASSARSAMINCVVRVAVLAGVGDPGCGT